jgi:hypothetical protein
MPLDIAIDIFSISLMSDEPERVFFKTDGGVAHR